MAPCCREGQESLSPFLTREFSVPSVHFECSLKASFQQQLSDNSSKKALKPSMKEHNHWECLGYKINVTYRWATLSPLRGGRMFPEPIRQLCTMARHCCTSSLKQRGKPGYLSLNCLKIHKWQTTPFLWSFMKVFSLVASVLNTGGSTAEIKPGFFETS